MERRKNILIKHIFPFKEKEINIKEKEKEKKKNSIFIRNLEIYEKFKTFLFVNIKNKYNIKKNYYFLIESILSTSLISLFSLICKNQIILNFFRKIIKLN
jgi:hypothetical protein